MFVIQCETLGFESSSVILSVGLQYFDETNLDSRYLNPEQNVFVKFSVKHQVEKYSRTINKSAFEWWKTQPEKVKKTSFVHSSEDKSVLTGIDILSNHVKDFSKTKKEIFWSRGYLTPMCINSLFVSADRYPLVNYNLWRDIRTAIDMTKNTSEDGYCTVPNFPINKENRHIPYLSVNDDAVMLLFGE